MPEMLVSPEYVDKIDKLCFGKNRITINRVEKVQAFMPLCCVSIHLNFRKYAVKQMYSREILRLPTAIKFAKKLLSE